MREKLGRNEYQIVCDECEETCTDTFGYDEFDEIIFGMKRDGWAILKEDGEWKHICEDCTK